MNKFTLKYILFTLLVLAVQILLLNNIQFSGYLNPYIYVMVIMLLPLSLPQPLVLLVSFFTGLLIDIATGTPGIHSSATLTAGFFRPYLLRYISPGDGYDSSSVPSMSVYGFGWFVKYALWMLLIHHFILFYLEVFRFHDFFRTLLRVLFSSSISLIFVILTERFRKPG